MNHLTQNILFYNFSYKLIYNIFTETLIQSPNTIVSNKYTCDATQQPTTLNIDTSLKEFHIRDESLSLAPFTFCREEQEEGGVPQMAIVNSKKGKNITANDNCPANGNIVTLQCGQSVVGFDV